MGSISETQASDVLPPRRGAVWAVAVDSTARAYDMTKLAFAGATTDAVAAKPQHVFLYLQAETNDVYFYFDNVTGTALADTGKQAATAGAVVFDDSYAAVLKAGNPPLRVRINRAQDKFIQLKATSTAGVLRMWASSGSE